MNFNKDGAPVKLPGVGTFTPSTDRDGKINIGFRADTALKNGLNASGAFRGVIANKTNIGVTNEKLKELWDADHSGDPLTSNPFAPCELSFARRKT